MKVRLLSLLLLTLANLTLWSCEPLIVGPSLSDVVIDNAGKAPTVVNNLGLCRCRVTDGAIVTPPPYLTFTFSGIRAGRAEGHRRFILSPTPAFSPSTRPAFYFHAMGSAGSLGR